MLFEPVFACFLFTVLKTLQQLAESADPGAQGQQGQSKELCIHHQGCIDYRGVHHFLCFRRGEEGFDCVIFLARTNLRWLDRRCCALRLRIPTHGRINTLAVICRFRLRLATEVRRFGYWYMLCLHGQNGGRHTSVASRWAWFRLWKRPRTMSYSPSTRPRRRYSSRTSLPGAHHGANGGCLCSTSSGTHRRRRQDLEQDSWQAIPDVEIQLTRGAMWRQLWVCPGILRRAHLSVGCEFGCRRSRASGEREILEVIKGGHECFFSERRTDAQICRHSNWA